MQWFLYEELCKEVNPVQCCTTFILLLITPSPIISIISQESKKKCCRTCRCGAGKEETLDRQILLGFH